MSSSSSPGARSLALGHGRPAALDVLDRDAHHQHADGAAPVEHGRGDLDAAYNEAFLTDNQGANVAAFPPTSDYFQGDEEKWSESFNEGSGRVFIGPVELDESTGVRAVQISAPVLDQGRTIGVLVVGITVEHIESRKSAMAQGQ